MPQRSNDFQQFVRDLERLLAPQGATVTESKMVLDRRTGRMREVDIVIEAKQVSMATQIDGDRRGSDHGD